MGARRSRGTGGDSRSRVRPLTAMSVQDLLADGLNDVAAIRTTFETIAFFPDDEALEREMREILKAARGGLAARLYCLARAVESDPAAIGLDCERFRRHALDLLERGLPGGRLNGLLRVDAFETGVFRLDLPGLPDAEAARRLPARRFCALLFRALHDQAAHVRHYADRETFDRAVYRPHLAALVLALQADTEPPFDERWEQ